MPIHSGGDARRPTRSADGARGYAPAIVFTAIALGFAVVYYVLITLAQQGRLPFPMGKPDPSMAGASLPGLLLDGVLRVFGPAVAALITASVFHGRAGLGSLWRSVSRWRAPLWLYALCFLGPLAVDVLIVAVGTPMGLLHPAQEPVQPLRFVVIFFMMILFDGPLGEEIGWRGFLLPELLRRMDPLRASFVTGFVWYVWHLPLYLADGREIHALSYLFNVMGTSFVFTWFYLRSGRSTFMTILLHATTNFALFLIIKGFAHADDIGTLQMIYNAIVGALAILAAFAMWKRPQAG